MCEVWKVWTVFSELKKLLIWSGNIGIWSSVSSIPNPLSKSELEYFSLHCFVWMFLPRPGILTGLAERPRSPGWRTAGPQLIPVLCPHPGLGGPVCPAGTEASPFRQFPAPATEERRVEERLASLMVIRPDVWTRCQAVSSMFDAPSYTLCDRAV